MVAETGTTERVRPFSQDVPVRSAPVKRLTPARSVWPDVLVAGDRAYRGSVY